MLRRRLAKRVFLKGVSMADPWQILVVEDDADVAGLVRLVLEAEGFEVATAWDGHAGLRQFFGEGADVVVLDLKLPGIDGWEVCQRIRAASSVPIILLTAYALPADREHGLALGANEYVCKPFSSNDLLHRIHKCLVAA